MKKTTLHILLFTTALTGAFFSFFYLLNQPFQSHEVTQITEYGNTINHYLFILSLFFLIYTFFLKKKTMVIVGVIFILVGLAYMSLMFSYATIQYYYLIPIIIYLLTGYIMTQNKKIR